MKGPRARETSPACRPSSDTHGRERAPVTALPWSAGALAVLLAAVLSAAAAQAQESVAAAPPCDAACLARELIRQIPAGERIGLVPFGPPSTAIPREVAHGLYDRIARALSLASSGRHLFTNKSRGDKAWESWQAERETSDYQDFWNKRRVGVTVHCADRGLEGLGVALSCTAFSVGEKSKLEGDIPGPRAVLPVERKRFQYEYTFTGLSVRLSKELAPGKIARVRITGPGGERSELTRRMEKTLRRVVEERLGERRRALKGQANEREVLGEGAGKAAPAVNYELRGRMSWMNDSVAELSVSLWRNGKRMTDHAGRFERGWLPEALIRPGTGRISYRASARAAPSVKLGEARARRAVKNLARARVVAKALGLPEPDIAEIRSERDGVRVLQGTLDRGIPVAERFSGEVKEDGGWRVELEARVIEVRSKLRPDFSARLLRDELRAMEEIVIELSAKEPVHTAVFAWGADNKVVRLYSGARTGDLKVPAGGTLVLPQAGEDRILSAPLPGNAADHEAIIVVAAAGERLPFRDLAPAVGGSVAATMKATVQGGVFFERLGRLDLGRTAVRVLPYRVSRK